MNFDLFVLGISDFPIPPVKTFLNLVVVYVPPCRAPYRNVFDLEHKIDTVRDNVRDKVRDNVRDKVG